MYMPVWDVFYNGKVEILFDADWKESGARSLRGGDDELGNLKP